MKHRTPLQSIPLSVGLARVIDGRLRPLMERSLVTVSLEQLARDCYTQGMTDAMMLHEAGRWPLPMAEETYNADFQI